MFALRRRSHWLQTTKRVAIPIGAIAGVALLGFVVARRRRGSVSPVIATVTINKPPEEVYAFFRTFEQLPRFMDYLESVEQIDETLSRWTAKLPGGRTVSWEAELIEDRPGELLAWQSLQRSPIQTRGRVTFTKTPGRNMTEVRVEMELGVTRIGTRRSFARWFAKSQIKGDLSRLKQVLETGEVLRSDASVFGKPHPAQPPEPGSVHVEPELIVEDCPAPAQKGVTP
jgi:uncharacterized membrane protein